MLTPGVPRIVLGQKSKKGHIVASFHISNLLWGYDYLQLWNLYIPVYLL